MYDTLNVYMYFFSRLPTSNSQYQLENYYFIVAARK